MSIYDLPENSGGWVYEYQALIAGVLALFSALITIYVMRRNHKDIRFRDNLKARAYIHVSANDISDFCKSVFEYIYFEIQKTEEEITPLDLSNHPIPEQGLNYFRDNIGNLDKKSAETVSKLLSKFQTFSAIAKTKDKMKKYKLERQLLDIVIIKILSDRTFEYARAPEKSNFNKKIPIKNDYIDSTQLDKTFKFLETDIHGYGVAFSPSSEVLSLFQERYNSRGII
jgi:hypothetical protein